MIILSTKTVYGIAALVDLATSPISPAARIDDIAERQSIPPPYLRQILIALKKSGIVESARGTRGGYRLARPASEIGMRAVVEALEGELRATDLALGDRALAAYFSEVGSRIASIFDDTLEDLVARRQRFEDNFVYHI